MKKRLLSSLGYGGAGVTLSFLLIVLIYPPYTPTRTLLPIYGLGLFLGGVLGSYKGKLNASGYAFIVGFLLTLILHLLWIKIEFSMLYSFSLLVIVVFVMGLVSAEDTLDVSIVPFAYFGGFVLASLIFMNFNMYEISGAIQSITLTGISGAVIATVVILLKSFLENTARLSKKI
ncbi:hypothetical protein EP1X_04135 [Thermococcus sp. EP1]|uniref:hypothetical protein n=1 Tax=Thermococcus sp. EP1 TaxID=1591054 RepID=UPI0006D9B6A5|nr:hypothetical protein [Thermococcus sp. EP1]KPU63528.1 hypothetical protein EP1X_04135 [Thermococcus sp. EP1]